MGLDWIVLSKKVDGREINPTEVIGARRASRCDPEVLAAITDYWNQNPQLRTNIAAEQQSRHKLTGILEFLGVRPKPMSRPDAEFRGKTLEEYISFCADKETPPIVVPFGKGCQDAIPYVAASTQYYGFRAQALVDERDNPLASFAKAKNISLEWAFNDISGEDHFQQAIEKLTSLLDLYAQTHPEAAMLATEGEDKRDPEYDDTPDEWEEAIEAFAICQGAVRWLRFWSDKGFQIAADY